MTLRTDIQPPLLPGSLKAGQRGVGICNPWNLLNQPSDVICWRSRDSEEIWAGIGCVFASESLEACRSLLSRIEVSTPALSFVPRCFGMVAFNPQLPLEKEWSGFPQRRFWIPQLLIRRTETRTEAIALSFNDELEFSKNSSGCFNEKTESIRCLAEESNLSLLAWQEAVEKIRSRIRSQVLRKAVLSRRIELNADKPFPVSGILARLAQQSAETFLFACRQPESGVFFGASPECLFRLTGRELIVDSLAGSRPRGKDRQSDLELHEQLAISDKDHREQQIVTDYVHKELLPLCKDLHTSAAQVRDLATIRHLHTEITGTLRDNVTSETVLDTLHPTPAVCGMPTDAARQIISDLEPDSRGLYAGAIGWADENDAEFAVAIRSGLIHGDKAMLFAGAGIVADSDAQNEYDECEWKLAGLRNALFPTL